MKVAILGGGFTGLSASYYLAKKGHEVTLLEKEPVLGGLAVGFKQPGWDWYLERAIHHLLGNDDDIVSFAEETGFNDIFWQATETASLYPTVISSDSEKSRYKQIPRLASLARDDMPVVYRTIPVDTPQDFLKFPYLPLSDKLRAGFVLAFLQFSPFLTAYEKNTAKEFLSKTMGKRAWEVLWQELFRKKFGKYAGNILASFMWARIKKRSKQLGYIKGGFQTLINHVVEKISKQKVNIKTGYTVESVVKAGGGFEVTFTGHPEPFNSVQGEGSDLNQMPKPASQRGEQVRHDTVLFDAVISTLPSPILPKITPQLFSNNYLSRFNKLKFLHAVSLVFETKEPLLESVYWLNVCAPDNKVMGAMQQTNFIDKKHYAGNHILYAYNYVEFEDPRIRMGKDGLIKFYLPELKKINSKFKTSPSKTYVFKGPFAQPIFDKDFLTNKPDFETPVKNFYIANLDMTYPYDRGTNYAVKLGREVSSFF